MGNECKGRRSRSMNKSAKNSRKNTCPEYHEPLAEQIPLTDLILLYRHSLPNVVVRKVLDQMYPGAKMAWYRLRRQYPISWIIARATLAAAFEERAATVYEEVAAANTGANEWELWDRLEARLFNASQVSIKRAEFEKARQWARETVDEFADRIRQLAGCLPEATPDPVLCSRFLNGVAIGLRREATIVDRGDFDNLVSTIARLAAVGPRRNEYVAQVEEAPRRSFLLQRGDGTRGGSHRTGSQCPADTNAMPTPSASGVTSSATWRVDVSLASGRRQRSQRMRWRETSCRCAGKEERSAVGGGRCKGRPGAKFKRFRKTNSRR
jgi:Retrotransposon gag protein